MRKLLPLLAFFIITSCTERYIDGDDYYYSTNYEPVIVSRDDLPSTIKMKPPREISKAGKIYRQGSMLFINDLRDGIHVIDNSNPSDPKKIAFLEIPGNANLSMFGNIMYVDHAGDLVTLRYENDKLVELDRNESVFPELPPPDNSYIPYQFTAEQRPENTVIIKWIEK